MLPIPHCFDDPTQVGDIKYTKDAPFTDPLPPHKAGVRWANTRAHNGVAPPWAFVPGRYCGSPEAWLRGGVRGVDPPLVWGWDSRSSCCRGDAMAGTPRGIMRWAADGVSAEDSRGLDDPASGCTAWSVGQCMPFVDMPWAARPANPAASRARVGVDTDGLPYILWPDGTWAYLLVSASGGALTDRRVPVWDAGSGRMVDSRIQDTGSGAVSVLAALSVNDLLNLVSTDGGIGAGTIRIFKDTTDGNYLLFTAPGSPASAWAAALKLRADPAGPVLELNSVPAGGTSALWIDGVPLGSAAFADTGDFDAAGAAATAQSNAESYADGVAATAQSNAESYADGVAATAESNAEAYADANFVPLAWSSVAAHQTSNQSLTHDAWNTIQLDSEDSDTLGEYNPSTYTFTPSASGLYAIDFRVSVTGGTTTQIASIWVGTSSELKRIASGASTTFGGATLVDLTAATGYTFRVFPSPGSPTTVSGASTTSLRIRRLA